MQLCDDRVAASSAPNVSLRISIKLLVWPQRLNTCLLAMRTAMATNPRTTISERAQLTVLSPGRRTQQGQSNPLKRRLLSTGFALVVLALVLRYLPSQTRNAQARATQPPVVVQAAPEDLHFSGVQISEGSVSNVDYVYVDGLITNDGKARVGGATAQVDFYDRTGVMVASVQKPLVGMAHGGTDLVKNEFARNPIGPNEMRFFRIAVDNVPPTWNHEVPRLKIVTVTAR
jgi:hypothetical protein